MSLFNQNLALVFGQFGAGKTFYAVQEAYDAYRRGDIVISNMWLAFPHIRWYITEELPSLINEVQDYHDREATPYYSPFSYLASHGIKSSDNPSRSFFFLIDEAGLFFNNRNFKKNFSDEKILEFFVQPRKYDATIAVIVQSIDMIDSNFTRLAQDVIEFRLYLGGFIRLGEAFDPKYLSNTNWDPNTPILYRKWYFHLYKTYKAKVKFFGGLYYTKEILGNRAIRHSSHILTLQQYLFEEKNKKDFHDWMKKMTKWQLFGISEEKKEEKSKNLFNTKPLP